MQKKITAILVFVGLFLFGQSDPICKKTSVYFDSNKSSLNKESKEKIRSIIDSIADSNYVFELYGFADSNASPAYNLKLSQKRVESVKKFLESTSKFKIKYREESFGESKCTAELIGDLSQERRVDIYSIPFMDNKVILQADRAKALIPVGYFEPCGLCSVNPQLKAVYTQEQAAAEALTFNNTQGETLNALGSFKVDYMRCDSQPDSYPSSIEYSIQAESCDPEMKLADPEIMNGTVKWKTSTTPLNCEPTTLTYNYTSDATWKNLHKKTVVIIKTTLTQLNLPADFNKMKSRVTSDFKTDPIISSIEDSLVLPSDSASFKVYSFGKQGKKYYYFKNNLGNIKSKMIETGPTTLTKRYEVTKEDYTQIKFTDTIISIKVKKKFMPERMGYYIASIDEFIPLEHPMNSKFFNGNLLKDDFQLAKIVNKKMYLLEPANLKMKYKKSKVTYKAKVNKKVDSKYEFLRPSDVF